MASKKFSGLGTQSLICLLVAAAVWVLGCGGKGNGSKASQYSLSVQRVVKLNLGLMMYANDWDAGLPLAGKWVDALGPYVTDSANFHSPAVGSPGYGYALNAAVAGHFLTEFPQPSTVLTIFDSTDLAKDATDPTTTLPVPPRYGAKNTMAYLDGHVQDEDNTQPPPDPYETSQKHLKQILLGSLMYSTDYDDTFPMANQWVDQTLPYVKNIELYRSPAVATAHPDEFGYAFNVETAGQRTVDFLNPSTLICIFDSTVLTRNATAATTTLPSPPRYGQHNTVGYSDGHVP